MRARIQFNATGAFIYGRCDQRRSCELAKVPIMGDLLLGCVVPSMLPFHYASSLLASQRSRCNVVGLVGSLHSSEKNDESLWLTANTSNPVVSASMVRLYLTDYAASAGSRRCI